MVEVNYIQHNPNVPSGRAAFISFLPKLKEHGSQIQNIRMLEDGPYIIMHHLWQNAAPFGADEMVAFHIIRFDENGLIAEHWNVAIEKFSRSLYEGETEIRELEKTLENKEIIAELFKRDVGRSTSRH